MEIVSVRFQDKFNKGAYSGREYSYIAGIPLEVGDIVAVPTKTGVGTAQVSRVNVPVSELRFDMSLLKTIEAFAPEQSEVLARNAKNNGNTGTNACTVPTF